MTPFARVVWWTFSAAVVVFLLSPLLLVVLFSFGQSPVASFPMGGLTLAWYEKLFANPDFWVALKNSLIVGFAVGAVSLITGTLGAMAMIRLEAKTAAKLLTLLILPVMLPPLVIALALLSSYSALDLDLDIHTVIPAQVVYIQPFVLLLVYARMSMFDHTVIDAARDLGASPLQAFLHVTLPIIQPTVVGAALIAMALSLDEFIITFYTIGGGLTLPTMVWGMLRTSVKPDANALATLILLGTLGATALALRLTRYRG